MASERVFPLTRGEGVTVAVIDSGVSSKHRVLDEGKVSYGEDYTEDQSGASCDIVGHGTVIAGVIAGEEDTEVQFHGTAPEAEIYAIRILPDIDPVAGDEISDLLAEAIDEAVDEKVDIINLSVAVPHTRKLAAAVKRAHADGVLLVAAAGNRNGEDGDNAPVYPAAYEGDDVSVIGVGNIGRNGEPAEKSNAGSYVDVAAPGQEIQGPSPISEDKYSEGADGTSYASAFVSGTAALVRSYRPELGPAEVADRIMATAEHPPHKRDEVVGHGVVDPYRAVTANLDKDTEHDTGRPAILHLDGDTEYFARGVAGVLLLVTVVLVLAVATWRTVVPRIRRDRALD